MTAFIQANTNGRLHAADEPSLTPLNRGFLYGDSIYEVWRTYHGVIFGWAEHWRRLGQSAAALFITLPFTSGQMLEEIKKTAAAFRAKIPGDDDVYIRLQVTRGEGAIGLDTALADNPGFVLLMRKNPGASAEKLAAGATLSIARALRRNTRDALNPAWKTGNYLNNILCLREARERGADEVVILNQAGGITEAAVSNIGFVRDGAVLTPPASEGILGGITREILINKIAPAAGVPVIERRILPAELSSMDECFLLSTTRDLTPVASIDEHTFNLNAPGSITPRLKAQFAEYAKANVLAHPELRLF